MYTDKTIGNKIHENRHGGDIARGTLTNANYGVHDEVSAYRAQYSYDGSFSFKPANADAVYASAFATFGASGIPSTIVNNINQIDAHMVNNIGEAFTDPNGNTAWGSLYSPLRMRISVEQWNNN
jgi:hypothetical protein